ncbi:unnamed protein product [Durusdinium trenchii]|uniref:Uncharacterized protein n=1 Tax=Durusdinium trenchii TaxID=1381693 RepID=A0ABP0QPP7_9DINO
MGVAKLYSEKGLEVLKLQVSEDSSPRVQAILHENGAGSVQLSDPFRRGQEPSYQKRFERVKSFLEDLGYLGHPGPACAKFWFANGLGRVIVYPIESLILSVHKRVKASKTTSWQRNSDQLAFLLPTYGSRGAISAATRMTYGNAFARAAFRGGGPFILKDSKDVTTQALKRLGYLDEWNTDEYEAMLCFVNSTHNKRALRKMDLLPEPSDSSLDVKDKLRTAFLSCAQSGQWQKPAAVAGQMKRIVDILKNTGLLETKETSGEYCSGYSQDEISQAIKDYAREQQLPPCKTFNCLAWRILGHIQPEAPTRRGTVEFRK